MVVLAAFVRPDVVGEALCEGDEVLVRIGMPLRLGDHVDGLAADTDDRVPFLLALDAPGATPGAGLFAVSHHPAPPRPARRRGRLRSPAHSGRSRPATSLYRAPAGR